MRPALHARPRAQPERWLLPTALGLVVLAADQLTKRWAVANLGPEPRAHVLPLAGNWLSLIYTQNTGVAFGLFQNAPQLFTVTSILITAGAVYAFVFHLPNRSLWVQSSVGLVVGGALGNIADRLRLGYVVDFISVGWWPIFNLADSAVSTGVTMLAGYLIFVGDEAQPEARPAPRDDGLLSDLLSRDVE